MAEALKSFFDRARVELIADELAAAWPELPRERFVARAVRGLSALELLDRGRHIARALGEVLPEHFPTAAAVVLDALRPERAEARGAAMESFMYLPHTVWVAERGLEHLEPSLELLCALTQRFTAEWAIRPFLVRYPEALEATLHTWSRHESAHVRRLVSEGTRPRLPWGARISGPLASPERTLPLLTRLRDDPSEYVRRSVANHLNDLTKAEPDRVVALLAEWSVDAPPERAAVIRHALRWLGKRGHAGALALLGAEGDADGLEVRGNVSPKRISVGDEVAVVVEVHNRSTRPRKAAVDLVVLHAGARGPRGPRVIKGKLLTLAPGASARFEQRVSFAPRSIRKILPGRHALEVQVNGTRTPLATVTVRE